MDQTPASDDSLKISSFQIIIRSRQAGVFRLNANRRTYGLRQFTKNYGFAVPRSELGSSLIPGPMVVEIATLLR